MFTDESRALFQDADVLVHEAYSFEESPVHADIDRLVAMAREERVKRLVFTHVRRDVRRQERIRQVVDASGGNITMPEPFDVVIPPE
jgi:ribonuclease BN (tRNA processing enzyme)